MRILGPALIIASLVLGGGGVALRSHADEADAQFGMTLLEVAETESCAARQSPLQPLRMQLPRRVSKKRVINLSNRGHNYRGLPAKPDDSLPASARN